MLALEALEEAIAIDPDFAEAHAELAIALRLRMNMAVDFEDLKRRATDAIETALRLDPDSARAHAARGLLADRIDTGVDDFGVGDLRRAVELDPSSVDAWLWLGNALHRSGESEQGEAAYRRAVLIDPLFPVANINLAFSETRTGRWPDAERRLLRLMDLPQPSVLAYLQLGQGYARFGREFDSMMLTLRWLARNPLAQGAVGLVPLIELFSMLGMWDEARFWVGQAARLPDERGGATAFYGASPLVAEGRFQDAADLFDATIAERGLDVASLDFNKRESFGEMLAYSGQHARAVALVENFRTPQTAPNEIVAHAPAYLALAWSYRNLGRQAESDRTLSMLTQLFAEREGLGRMHRPQDLENHAVLHAMAGRTDDAIDTLEQLLDSGWNDYYRLANRPVWQMLRDDPRYKVLEARARDSLQAQRKLVESLPAIAEFKATFEAALRAAADTSTTSE